MILVRVLFALAAITVMVYAARAPGRKPLDRFTAAVVGALGFYFSVFTVWRPAGTIGIPVLLLLLGGALITFAFRERRKQEAHIGLLLPGIVSACWGVALLLEAERIARMWPW